MKYERFVTPCDMSYITIGEAAQYLGPSFTYELRVSRSKAFEARLMLKQFAVGAEGHPIAPHINLEIDDTYALHEWSLLANGKAMGSEGV